MRCINMVAWNSSSDFTRSTMKGSHLRNNARQGTIVRINVAILSYLDAPMEIQRWWTESVPRKATDCGFRLYNRGERLFKLGFDCNWKEPRAGYSSGSKANKGNTAGEVSLLWLWYRILVHVCSSLFALLADSIRV